jgi:hypothetical protein
MTKAVSLSLGFVFLLASIAASPAQTSAADVAVNEAVLRQANAIVLRQKLADASSASTRGDLPAAAKLYEDAYALVTQIGSGIDVEKAQTISGFVSTRLELAREAQGRGDLHEADTQINRALKIDPQNATALAFKKQNDQMLASMRGKMPDAATLEKIPTVVNAHADASTLVQDGKLLYEMGKLEEAEAKLNAALKLDPDNEGAYYYLNLIKQARYNREDHLHTVVDNDRMVQVQRAWDRPMPNTSLPTPNPYGMTNLIYTGSGRQSIVSKLDRIRLDNVSFDSLPLSEVVRYLSEQAKLRDPEKKGINFLINPNGDTSGGAVASATPGAGGATTVDPATGLPVAAAGGGGESVDLNSVVIKINPALSDVRLADVLDAIVQVADHPIRYTIADYAIIFSAKGPESPQLLSRHFRVDANTFYQGLQSVDAESFGSVSSSGSGSSGGGGGGGGGSGSSSQNGAVVPIIDAAPGAGSARGGSGGGGSSSGGGLRYITLTNSTVDISLAARSFFQTLGVDLTAPGKAIFFNDRLGELFVRATEQDLDTIENAIEVLNHVSPQVHVKARFIEVAQEDDKALGFDWYLGNFTAGNVQTTAGNAGSVNVPVTQNNPSGTFPGNALSGTLIPQGIQSLTSGLRNPLDAPAVASITGILTDPNFQVVLHALEQRSGTETLAEPEIVTTSGRQTQVRATELETIITGFTFQQGSAPQASGASATP